jgi:GTPase SAR1 family protein
VARLPVTGSQVFGREDDIAFLDAAWEKPQVNVVTIVAWAGVGKSTLVNHWLRRMAAKHYRSAELVFGWSFYRQVAVGALRPQMNFLMPRSLGLVIQTLGSERPGRRAKDWQSSSLIVELY